MPQRVYLTSGRMVNRNHVEGIVGQLVEDDEGRVVFLLGEEANNVEESLQRFAEALEINNMPDPIQTIHMRSPQKMLQQLVHDIGIEIEYSDIEQRDGVLNHFLRHSQSRWMNVHDRSTESNQVSLFGIRMDQNQGEHSDILKMGQSKVIGGELVSPIINSNSPCWAVELEQLLNTLKSFGETEDSTTDSIHVHINVTNSVPLSVLVNTLKITLCLEKALFRIGGMGRQNRGDYNQYIYSRPFSGKGPIVVAMSSGNYPIYETDKMLSSRTKEEFFKHYGDAVYLHQNYGTKYVTQRYSCVNFYPVLSQGTIEFRQANKTLTTEYVIAWVLLCKAIVQKAFSENVETEFDVVHSIFSDDMSEDELVMYLRLLGLDDSTIDILHELYISSPPPKILNSYVYSHLPSPSMWYSRRYLPEKISETPLKVNLQREREVTPRNPVSRLGLTNRIVVDMAERYFSKGSNKFFSEGISLARMSARDRKDYSIITEDYTLEMCIKRPFPTSALIELIIEVNGEKYIYHGSYDISTNKPRIPFKYFVSTAMGGR